MKTQLLVSVISVFTLCSFGQSEDFEYDKKIAVKYAITAMVEYNAHNTNIRRDFMNDFDTSNPLVYGRYLEDCAGIKQKVVLVTFNKLDGNSSANIYMVFSKDNYFKSFLERGYSIDSNEIIYKGFKKHDFNEDLFGCYY